MMSRYIAFLRAINVGNGRTVKMKSLRQLFEALGFSEVATFISSGNVVFETGAKNTKNLERKIEKKLREALEYEVATFIRIDKKLAEIANYNPFQQSKVHDTAELNVIFLKDTLQAKLKRKVMALKTETDEFRVQGREVYWLRRKKRGQSIFSTVPLDKALDHPFTIRSAKTLKSLMTKLSSLTERSSS